MASSSTVPDLEKAIPLDASDPVSLGRIEKAAEKHFASDDWKATLKWLMGQAL